MEPETKASDGELYPIRTVSALTGVNAVTLRAWERRYGLVQPRRTPKGHRLYSRADIERIRRVLQLLERGISISQARRVLEAEEAAAGDPAGPWQQYLGEMLDAVIAFDDAALEAVYNQVLSLYPVDLAFKRLVVPLLERLGRRWETGEGTVAEEHFFGVYLRNKLGARLHHVGADRERPRLLAACMEGELHEVGLILFTLRALEQGFRPVLLGADMPLDELAEAARRSRSAAIVLSGSERLDWEERGERLARLIGAAGRPVFVGGGFSVRHGAAITQAGGVALGDDIDHGLRQIGERLSAVA